MADWERRVLLALLSPLLWLQTRHVRRIAPRMPEPPGQRAGTTGNGSLVRLLMAGDSGAPLGWVPRLRSRRCVGNWSDC